MSSPYQKKLDLIEDREFRARFPNDTFTGCPYFYRVHGTSTSNPDYLSFAFYPIPDAVYTIKYDGVRPIELPSSDSMDIRVTTGMPSMLADVLIDMATAIGFVGDDDVKADRQLASAIARLENAYKMNDSQIDDRLVARPFGGVEDMQGAQDPWLPTNYSI